MDKVFAELITLPEAEKETGFKVATVRRWVKDGLVAGIQKKPMRVHRPDLIQFLTHRANPAFRKLCSIEKVGQPSDL